MSNPRESARVQRDAEVEASEMTRAPDYGALMLRQGLVHAVLEDGTFKEYFEPFYIDENGKHIPNKKFSSSYLPLEPFTSRRLCCGKNTVEALRKFRGELHATIQQCHTLAKTRNEHIMINSLEKMIFQLVASHSLDGFLLRQLTTEERNVTMRSTPVPGSSRHWYERLVNR